MTVSIILDWWASLGGNILLNVIYKGELTTKYFGPQRRVSSLTFKEIVTIWQGEHKSVPEY